MRRIWIHNIYTFICSYYLSNKKHTVDCLEIILLLMQIETLEKYGHPFIDYKICIHNGEVRIPYLSDLIRINPHVTFSDEGFVLVRRMDKYMKMYRKYKRMDEIELRNLFSNINIKELDKRYFINEEYNDMKLRRLAQLKINNETKPIYKMAIRKLLGIFSIGFVIAAIYGSIMMKIYYPHQDITNLLKLFLGSFPFMILWGIWTWNWMQPTGLKCEKI